jgi:hypothetical protein
MTPSIVGGPDDCERGFSRTNGFDGPVFFAGLDSSCQPAIPHRAQFLAKENLEHTP